MGQTRYWLLTGALMGFGVIASLSIGFPFLVLGLILVIVGLIVGALRRRITGFWAVLVGFGGLPALILLWDVTSAPWACLPAGGGFSQPNVNYYTCVDTAVGPLTTYHIIAFGFSVIALLGLAWPLVHHLWRQASDTHALRAET
jgi:hypothetical protein